MDKASGDYSVITRDDGKKQWALKGKPLYFWAKDMPSRATRLATASTRVWQVAKP
jgi:predicted lipoprotein with Yx(FWY)xxD motif